MPRAAMRNNVGWETNKNLVAAAAVTVLCRWPLLFSGIMLGTTDFPRNPNPTLACMWRLRS